MYFRFCKVCKDEKWVRRNAENANFPKYFPNMNYGIGCPRGLPLVWGRKSFNERLGTLKITPRVSFCTNDEQCQMADPKYGCLIWPSFGQNQRNYKVPGLYVLLNKLSLIS